MRASGFDSDVACRLSRVGSIAGLVDARMTGGDADAVTDCHWLLTRAEQTPDAAAIESDDESWTFAQLADQARRAARFVLATSPETVLPGESPKREWSMTAVAKSEARWGEIATRELQSGDASADATRSGDFPIALLLPGDARFAAWFHGIALAGRTVLPLNLRLTAGEIAGQLADARVRLLLGEAGDPRLDELCARVAGLRIQHAQALPLEEAPTAPSIAAKGSAVGGAESGAERASSPVEAALSSAAAHRVLPGERFELQSTLAVLFTSGTAGRAKGACLTYGNFLASAAAAAERLGPAVSGRWLCCMPLFHVGGLSILIRSTLFGGPVRLQPRFDPAAVSEALDRDDVAGISLVPTMLSRLLDHRGNRPAPASLRVVLLGGAAAAPALVERALAAGYPVCPTYGLTEAASQVATAAPPTRACEEPGVPVRRAIVPPTMRALTGVELRIASEAHEPGARKAGKPGRAGEQGAAGAAGVASEAGAAGEVGEILVRGPVVMKGYLHDAAATARVLRDGWLHTGDVGYLDADGGLHVLDRRDDLVVTGGENVYPAEIEAVLLEHPAVADAGVAGVPDADLGARVVAWVVCHPGAAADAATLASHCAGRLAGFKQPREFRFVEALPRNAAGKLQRRRLTGIKVRS